MKSLIKISKGWLFLKFNAIWDDDDGYGDEEDK